MKSPDTDEQSVQPAAEDDLGPGLCFFPRQTTPSQRRRRYIFLAAWITISGMLVWPIYPLFAGVRPLVAGLPLSLAWILLAMVLMCAFLFWLFLGEEQKGGRNDG